MFTSASIETGAPALQLVDDARFRDGSGLLLCPSTTVEAAAQPSGKSALPCRTAEAAVLVVVRAHAQRVASDQQLAPPRVRGSALRQADDVTERDFVPWVRGAFLAKLRLAFGAGSQC